jgi:NhaA family Na+:H+ antiporter
MSGVALLFSTPIALALANTAWSPQFFAFWEISAAFSFGPIEVFRSLKHWVKP